MSTAHVAVIKKKQTQTRSKMYNKNIHTLTYIHTYIDITKEMKDVFYAPHFSSFIPSEVHAGIQPY